MENNTCMAHIRKGFDADGDPIIRYCTELSVRQHPMQKLLQERTLAETGELARMLGAPQVLQLGANIIQLIGARRCLDIGTFTGASALAWALAISSDGQVISIDVSHDYFDKIGRPIISSDSAITGKIDFRLGSAVDVLDTMIKQGESGKFDFAFIDADKHNYVNYYHRCLELLRSGGVILVDNALYFDTANVVTNPRQNDRTIAVDELNHLAHRDERVTNSLLTLADGTHLIFKK